MKYMWFNTSSQGLILSVSGWRKIFSSLENPYHISKEDLTSIYYAILSYIEAQGNATPADTATSTTTTPLIAIGCDSRPSGIILLELLRRTLAELNCNYSDLGIIPGPAIMAYTKQYGNGFIYLTASHNPPEYNGIKFGSAEGKVQNADEHAAMMKIFYAHTAHSPIPPLVLRLIEDIPSMSTPEALALHNRIGHQEEYHKACLSYKEVVFKSVFRGLENFQDAYRQKLARYIAMLQKEELFSSITKIGIIIDPNGGARTWTYDKEILAELGIHTQLINSHTATFAHDIIPEGHSLSDAKTQLHAHNTDADKTVLWPFAITCDCDGDRGNTSFSFIPQAHDTQAHATEETHISFSPYDSFELSAQEVFALVLKIELAWEQYLQEKNEHSSPVAVVVNGPSSLRNNIIATHYGSSIARCEVGEANVVSKGIALRNEGYAVPLVGEASNGGVIMYPSTVRDPMCTILSLLKGLLWAKELKLETDLVSIMHALPLASSTPTEDPLAKLTIPNTIAIKDLIHTIFSRFAEHSQSFLDVCATHGIIIDRYTYTNFRHTHTNQLDTTHSSHIPKDLSGGIAIYFWEAEKNIPSAFVWLRPSGTEPFVRLLADAIGPHAQKIERALISVWKDYLTLLIHPSNSHLV